MKEFILKDRAYETQTNNFNPDGTSNMVRTKAFGRFNQCFISSSAMALRQVVIRLRENGLEENPGSIGTFIDEHAYLASMLSKLNNGDASVDNDERYWWQKHCELLNDLTQGFFKSPVNGKWVWHKHDVNKIIEVIKTKYQPIVGIYIGDYYRGGGGHIVTAVGWREDDNGKFLGLIINDPAGNLLAKKSYTGAGLLDGQEVFYSKEVLNKLLGKNQMMYFLEN